MKVLSLLLMILVVLIIGLAGILYFFGFIMSFDAPGSADDPKAWWGRLMMFLPVIFCIVIEVLAIQALWSGRYGRSALFSGSLIVAAAAFWFYATFSSMATARAYRTELELEKEQAIKYPVQKFLRDVEGGTDTIIVWPNRIVAYRLYIAGLGKPWSGPLGDLNEGRDTLIYYEHVDTRLRRQELGAFYNMDGRRFTEVYITH
jgi:hypothetical protein